MHPIEVCLIAFSVPYPDSVRVSNLMELGQSYNDGYLILGQRLLFLKQ